MKWIIGLGNPGSDYRNTRHNVGFMAVDRFANQWKMEFRQSKFKAYLAEGNVKGQKVLLLKPTTFMNLSGEAARAFMDFYKADIADLIIVYDDLDLPLGRIRLRYQGSAGGHNGMKSLIQHLGTQVFNRVRIGISRPNPGANIADYVLSNFSKSEAESLEDSLCKTCDALEAALELPYDKVMAQFNQ